MKVKFTESDSDLVFLMIEDGEHDNRRGTFYLHIKNGTNKTQVHSIGIICNHSLFLAVDGRPMNAKASKFTETRIITIPPGEIKKFVFSWKDVNEEAKSIEIIAKFKAATSETLYIWC